MRRLEPEKIVEIIEKPSGLRDETRHGKTGEEWDYR